MATNIGKESQAVEMLEHLVALDLDAIEAYQAAIDRLEAEEYRSQLALFKGDHERHVRELRPLVEELGGKPPESADAKSMLTKGKVMMADIAGDKQILQAMKSNEDDTNTAYDRASARHDMPETVHALLERNDADEHRHRAWIETTLQRLQ